MSADVPSMPAGRLHELRARADQDFVDPSTTRVAGRHQVDVSDLGLRIAITRSRYPNRADGVDQYAVTVTRSSLDSPAADTEVRLALEAAFGDAAAEAVERTGAGALVRMFRVPAA